MTNPKPLLPKLVTEIPLRHTPLVRVVAQIRFPPILSIHESDKVATFQDLIRDRYPFLSMERVHSVELLNDQAPKIQQEPIWRLSDSENDQRWRVSLGVDFIALETVNYESRQDFLDRLSSVVLATKKAFNPASVQRCGLRYIDRMTGDAVKNIGDLIQPGILGIKLPHRNSTFTLGNSAIQLMSEAQFITEDKNGIQCRWGELPENVTYDQDVLEAIPERSWILDLDMFTLTSQPFISEGILTQVTGFAESIYWLFRQMVTEEFLKFYGGDI